MKEFSKDFCCEKLPKERKWRLKSSANIADLLNWQTAWIQTIENQNEKNQSENHSSKLKILSHTSLSFMLRMKG